MERGQVVVAWWLFLGREGTGEDIDGRFFEGSELSWSRFDTNSNDFYF